MDHRQVVEEVLRDAPLLPTEIGLLIALLAWQVWEWIDGLLHRLQRSLNPPKPFQTPVLDRLEAMARARSHDDPEPIVVSREEYGDAIREMIGARLIDVGVPPVGPRDFFIVRDNVRVVRAA